MVSVTRSAAGHAIDATKWGACDDEDAMTEMPMMRRMRRDLRKEVKELTSRYTTSFWSIL